jgi:hypothetical protein
MGGARAAPDPERLRLAALAGLLLFSSGCYAAHERVAPLHAGRDAGTPTADVTTDARPPTPDRGTDVMGPMPDGGTRCGVPIPSGDTRWPQYRLPGTPGMPRSYLVGTDTTIDCVTGLEWQRAVARETFSPTAAIAYCDGLVLGGHDDWRLPSTIELMTLVDYTIASPAIDSSAFPATPGDYFWTASPVEREPDPDAEWWYVNFDDGSAYYAVTLNAFRARCVR